MIFVPYMKVFIYVTMAVQVIKDMEKDFDRRARIINIVKNGSSVFTWKTLYNSNLTSIDYQKLL